MIAERLADRYRALGPEQVAVSLLSILLLAAIGAVAERRGLLGSAPPDLRAGDRYDHWTEDPRIDGWQEVPPDYYGPRPDRTYRFWHPERPYGVQPNVTEWFVGTTHRLPGTVIRTNRFGFRDDPMDRSAPSGTLRIFAVGASETFGIAVNASASWPEQLERMLRGRLDRRVQVVNTGVPGFGIREMYGMITERVVAMDPDLVVVAFMRNDDLSRHRARQVQRRLRRQHPNMSHQQILELEQRWFRSFHQNFSQRWRQDRSDLKQYLPRIDAVLAERGVPAVLYAFRGLYGSSREPFRMLAERHNLTMIFPAPALRHPPRYEVLPQDGHLSAEGYRIVARRLARRLRERYDLAALAGDADA